VSAHAFDSRIPFERAIGNVQMLLVKPDCRRAPLRSGTSDMSLRAGE
jgi:hypothetical protein